MKKQQTELSLQSLQFFQERSTSFLFHSFFQRTVDIPKSITTNGPQLKNTTFIHENLSENNIEPVINVKFIIEEVRYNPCKSNNNITTCTHIRFIWCTYIVRFGSEDLKAVNRTTYSTENKRFILPFIRLFWIILIQRDFAFEWYNLLIYSKEFFH